MDENTEPSGTEASTTSEGQGDSGSKAIISEDFQKSAHVLLDGCNEEELDYLQKCCDEKEQEMTQAGAGDADDSQGPSEYSSEEMPKD